MVRSLAGLMASGGRDTVAATARGRSPEHRQTLVLVTLRDGRQVQVLFPHTTYHGASDRGRVPPRPFPEVMQNMQWDLKKVLAYCVTRFPNLKIAYLTSVR